MISINHCIIYHSLPHYETDNEQQDAFQNAESLTTRYGLSSAMPKQLSAFFAHNTIAWFGAVNILLSLTVFSSPLILLVCIYIISCLHHYVPCQCNSYQNTSCGLPTFLW